ncbi:MAG: type IX secretion system membrane protein PorP/SprF [Chitinophagales bacterium]|nr:type IX secretion system membrane protein PorP/SprF [Chitinophagales bacterium]
MRKVIFTFLFAALGIALTYAQQDPQFSMYMFNGQYINPAYVGSRGVLDMTGLYRYQWAGQNFEGSPQSMSIGLNTPFKKQQYAIGVYTGYDHIGFVDMYNLMGQFAYRINVKKSKISLGVQAGFYHYNNNKTSHTLFDPNDEIFAEENVLFTPNIGAGIHVYSDRYFVGASFPHLLNMNLSQKLQYAATNSDVNRQYRHFFATAGVVIGKETSTVKFKPTILLKYVQGLDKKIPDFDLNANFLFVDRFWLGAGVRTGGNRVGPYFSDIVGMFECLITQQLRVGYSYDYVLSDLSNYTHGSHEIMLGYSFGYQKKKFVNVRYGTYF